MARTIAEVLAYNRAYSPKLNPNLFNEDDILKPEVSSKIKEIVDAFLKYAEVDDITVLDIRLVGSNASYNYNEHSDVDIHIVTDLSKIANPETIARLYFDSIKKSFKDSFDIKIKGIDVEMYVEDIKVSAQSNGIYSVTTDHWIKEPEVMPDPTDEQIEDAEEIEEDIINRIKSADSIEILQAIIDEVYLMRKNALAKEGETAPANLAFKSLRNKGILKQVKDTLQDEVSKELSLESKNLRESTMTPNILKDLLDKSYKAISSGDDYGLSPEGDELDKYVRDKLKSMPVGTEFKLPNYSDFGTGWHNHGRLYRKIDTDKWEVLTINQDDSLREKSRVASASRLVTEFYQYIKDCGHRYLKESKKMRESVGFDELKYNLFSSTPNYNRFFNEVAKLIRDIPYEKLASGITVYKDDFNVEIPKEYISKFARDMKSYGYVTRVSATGLGVRISARSDESKTVNEDVEYKGFTIEEKPWTIRIGDKVHKTTAIYIRKDNFLYTPVEDNRENDGEEWIERPCKSVDDAKEFIDNIDHATYKRVQFMR